MWTIYEHKTLVRRIPKIPQEVLKRYEKWKDIVSISGPGGLRLIKGFHDEALKGDRKGDRSSRLGFKYRVIYKIDNDQLYVMALNINAHDYRRR